MTYQRTGSQSSSLDHIFTNFQTNARTRVISTHTSDHDYMEIELQLEKEPYKTEPKEFYYSNKLNNPKL